jgi:uncharacterized protein YbaA (DUF1428 family)
MTKDGRMIRIQMPFDDKHVIFGTFGSIATR